MRVLAAAALISILIIAPAHAQGAWASITADTIGQAMSNMNAQAAERACLSGLTNFPDRAMASARDGAMRTMTSYVTSASASAAANVSRSFSGDHRRQSWTADGQHGDVRSVSDPLARRLANNGAPSVPAPDAFIRSGDGATAEALWVLRDPSDPSHVAGSYLARFQHELFRGWVLSRLSITTGAELPRAPTSYCHEDGDIAPTTKKDTETTAASSAEPTQEPTPQTPPATATPR